MNGFAVLALILLAVVGNLLWFWLKNDLQQLGYKTHFFRGHFNDLSNASEVIKKTDDPQTKRTYRSVLYSIIAVIILMPTIFFMNMPTRESHRCKRFNDYLEHEVTGVVESKYVDSQNHNYETLILTNGEKERETQRFARGLFEFLEPGDSLNKRTGNTELQVYRLGQLKTFNVERTDWCNE